MTQIDRRRVLGCAALFGITGPLLVACSESSTNSEAAPTGGANAGGEASADPSAGSGSSGLIGTAEVPAGGGVVIADQGVVVVQPTEGDFKAYTSVCTHQGNPVGAVGDGKITCGFHGAQFSVDDGSNVTGPNGQEGGTVASLAAVEIKVEGDQIVRA